MIRCDNKWRCDVIIIVLLILMWYSDAVTNNLWCEDVKWCDDINCASIKYRAPANIEIIKIAQPWSIKDFINMTTSLLGLEPRLIILEILIYLPKLKIAGPMQGIMDLNQYLVNMNHNTYLCHSFVLTGAAHFDEYFCRVSTYHRLKCIFVESTISSRSR